MSGTVRRPLLIGVAIIVAAAAAAAGWYALEARRSALFVSPGELAFGDVAVGETSEAFVIATNQADEGPLRVRLATSEPFRAMASEVVLEPGVSQTLSIVFAPESTGEAKGTLVLESERGAVRIALSGSAHGVPAVHVDPAALEFGEVAVGGTASSRIRVENRGHADLEITSLRAPGPYEVQIEPQAIPAGAAADLEVRFAPQQARTWRSRLEIETNDPVRREIVIPVVGRGVDGEPHPQVAVETDVLDFGDVPVGTSRRSRLTIRNLGSDPLTLSSLLLPPPFRAPTRSRTIAPGASLALPVMFAPPREAAFRGSLVIHTNDPSMAALEVTLAGRGAPRGLASRGSATGPASGSSGSEPRLSGAASGAAGLGPDGGDPNAPLDPNLGPGDADGIPTIHLLEGSQVRLGSYPASIADMDLGALRLDPASGVATVEGLQLPTVYAAMNEYFTFSPTDGFGTINELGDVDLVVPLELYDRWGNPGGTVLTLTTGTATTVVGGRQISITGAPVGSDGMARLVGLATFDKGPLRKQTVRVVLNVQVDGGE